jgi:hypothetical protein
MARRVVVEAADGYRVVFALAELDPSIGARHVLVVDREDGNPLSASDGPYRLVVEGEVRPARWSRQVVAFHVRSESP